MALADDWDLVLGHSLGGGVAVTGATRRPGWARKLVLEDPALRLDGQIEDVRSWLLEPYEGATSAERIAAEQPRWAPEDCEAKAEAIHQSSPDVVHGFLDHNFAADLTGDVAALTVPTLLMGADPELDAVVPADGARQLEAANPLVTYVMIPGSGHSIHRDSYPPFWEAVRQFVEQ